MKNRSPNPLNVFDLRRTNHLPPHFYSVVFDSVYEVKPMTDWIWENLEGRFYFGDFYSNDNASTLPALRKCAAFEIHSEASYFSLVLVDLNS